MLAISSGNLPGIPLNSSPNAPAPRTARFLGGLALLCISTSLFAPLVQGQSREDLNTLIFEAKILDPVSPQAQYSGSENGQDTSVTPEIAGNNRDTEAVAQASLQQDIARYQASINALTESNSPYSEAMREQMLTIARLYQLLGEHEKAIEQLETALHIERINHGLFTTRQIELVNLLIASDSALGHAETVADRREYLYYIQRKSYADDDPRLLAATESWADWNLESWLRDEASGQSSGSSGFNSLASSYVAVQNPVNGSIMMVPRQNLGSILNPNGISANAAITDMSLRNSAYAINPEAMIDDRLLRAEKLYEELLESDLAKQDPNQQLVLQRKLANTGFAAKQQIEALTSSVELGSLNYNRVMNQNPTNALVNRRYLDSKEALETLAGKISSDPQASIETKAQAWLDLGDWHQGFGRNKRASEAYYKAWELIQPLSPGDTGDSNNAFLNPELILPVPGFAIQPYSRQFYGMAPDTELQFKGYIDVTLTLDRYGKVKREKIIATSPDTSQTLRSTLLDFLRDNRMRPPIRKGETVTVENINLRYYYYY